MFEHPKTVKNNFQSIFHSNLPCGDHLSGLHDIFLYYDLHNSCAFLKSLTEKLLSGPTFHFLIFRSDISLSYITNNAPISSSNTNSQHCKLAIKPPHAYVICIAMQY